MQLIERRRTVWIQAAKLPKCILAPAFVSGAFAVDINKALLLRSEDQRLSTILL